MPAPNIVYIHSHDTGRYVQPYGHAIPTPHIQQLAETPETRRDMAAYINAARTLDAKMGRVFAALRDNGLADNTLVICTTDHGLAFPTMITKEVL